MSLSSYWVGYRASGFCWDTSFVCSFDIDNLQSSTAIWPEVGLTTVKLGSSKCATTFDFSSISSISSFYVSDSNGLFIFDPTNITRFDGYGADVSFLEGKLGGRVSGEFNNCKETIQNILDVFSEVDLTVRNDNIDFSEYNNCEKIFKLSNFKEYESDYSYSSLNKLTNLETLELLNGGNITISDVNKLTKLTTVKIADPVGNDILTKLPIANLVTLELTNSKITDISPLMNATKLERLSLANGVIFDRFSYGDQTNVSTLQIFIDLRKQYGKLKRLYLAGCKNILDWSILEKCGIVWDDWSGFSGR